MEVQDENCFPEGDIGPGGSPDSIEKIR